MTFVVGAWILLIGYALFFTGLINERNGGNGPSFLVSLGLNNNIVPGSYNPTQAQKRNPKAPPAKAA